MRQPNLDNFRVDESAGLVHTKSPEVHPTRNHLASKV